MMSRVPAFVKYELHKLKASLELTNCLLSHEFWARQCRAQRIVSGVMQYNALQSDATANVEQYSILKFTGNWMSGIIFYSDTLRIAMQFVFYDHKLLWVLCIMFYCHITVNVM